MKQECLFEDGGEGSGSTVLTVGVTGSTASLTKAQKQFNKLVAKIAEQRQQITQWQAFVPLHLQRCAAEIDPLVERLREKHIAKVHLLDKAMDAGGLTKVQRAKVRDILIVQLSELISESEDAELVRLYDKYAEVSFDDERQSANDMLRAMASETFGIDVDEASTPEELAQRIGERMATAKAEPARPPQGGRKKSAKAIAQEAMREQAAKNASQSMREVYRKLVSELHPDREQDIEERARKTSLMQKVNNAYESGDLLALLELQLTIEQIDPAALANLADERLAHYIHVLSEQSQRLQQELFDLTEPFSAAMYGRWPRQVTPEAVQHALSDDVRELTRVLEEMDRDLLRCQDIRELKKSLKDYQIAQYEDEMLADFVELLRASPKRRRR